MPQNPRPLIGAYSPGCAGGREVELAYSSSSQAYSVYRETYEGCPPGGDVLLYRLEHVGHVWPSGEFSASWTIGEFFHSH